MRPAAILIASLLAAGGAASAFAQPAAKPPARFYNVDTERRVEGVIREILLEPRYEDRSPFLIIVLEEKTTGQRYKVELSPAWFFDQDLHQGEPVKIIGSLSVKEKDNVLIARELQAGGETFRLRDGRGFPNWRGGPMNRLGKRRGRGM
jgi:hypothetical protein